MKLRIAILAALATAAATAQAATATYGVSAGVATSDNIARAPVNEKSETMLTAGLDFSLLQETAKLSALAAADFSYVDYQDQTFNSEVVGNFTGQAKFRFVPERFEWFAQDNFGQVRSDPFQAVTPLNRENINYFTTGPDLMVGFGSTTRGRLSGRYSKVSYENSPLDSDQLGATLSLLKNLSAASVLSLNLQTQKTEYDEAALASSAYDRRDLFAGYTANLSRTRANLELGYSILSRDNTTRDSKGVLARLDLQRQLSAMTTLSLRVGHEFSDAGSSFRLQQDIGMVNLDTQSVVQTTDPFTNEYVSLSWALNGRRTGLGADVGVFDESYEQQTVLDRRRTTANAYASRNLTQNLRFQLRGGVSKEDFKNLPNGNFRETVGSAALTWQAGRRLSVSLQYDRAKRSADIASSEYQENRGTLQIRWGEGNKAMSLPSAPPRSTPAGDLGG